MLDKLKRLREAWQKKLAKFYEWHTEHAILLSVYDATAV